MIKKVVVLTSIVVLLGSSFNVPYAYAQSQSQAQAESDDSICDVCSSSAKPFQTYLTAMEESIETLTAIIISRSPEPKPVNLDASQYAKIGASFNDQMNEMLVDFATPDGIGFADLKIQNASDIVQRDWRKLDMLSQKITKLFSLSFERKAGSKEFTIDDVRNINGALAKTKIVQFQLSDTGTPTIFTQGKRYNELIGTLRRINRFMKELYLKEFYHTTLVDVGSGTLQAYTKDPNNAEKSVTSEKWGAIAKNVARLEKKILINGTTDDAGENIRWLEFTNEYTDLYLFIREMQSAMSCATGRRNECDEKYTSRIAQSAKTSANTFKGDLKSANNTFISARRRLSGTMFSGAASDRSAEAAKSRETELLQQYYGDSADALLEKKGIIRTIGKAITKKEFTFGDARRQLSETSFADPVSDYDETIGTILTSLNTKEKEQVKRDANYADSLSKKEMIQQQKEWFETLRDAEYDDGLQSGGALGLQFEQLEVNGIQQAYNDAVLLSKDLMDLERLLDTSPITKQFPQLSLNVSNNYQLVGKKSDDPSITQAAVGVCEIQCENLNPNCYDY